MKDWLNSIDSITFSNFAVSVDGGFTATITGRVKQVKPVSVPAPAPQAPKASVVNTSDLPFDEPTTATELPKERLPEPSIAQKNYLRTLATQLKHTSIEVEPGIAVSLEVALTQVSRARCSELIERFKKELYGK